jgi:hypothetical protein
MHIYIYINKNIYVHCVFVFFIKDIGGNVIDSWEGIRLQCLHVTNDGIILAADTQRRISSYKFDSLTDQQL